MIPQFLLLLVMMAPALLLATVLVVMAVEALYQPARARGQDYRYKAAPIPGFPENLYVQETGERTQIIEKVGSASTAAVPGSGGIAPIDCSAFVDNITLVEPRSTDRTHVAYWDRHDGDSTIEHGIVTSGPFTVGNTLTGADSAATATIVAVGVGFVQVGTITGTYKAGEVVDDTSANAVVTHPTLAAGADGAEQDIRRFVFLVFNLLSSGANLGNGVAVLFTFTGAGDPIRSLQDPNATIP